MALPAGWDRHERWTLRFADRELELCYQLADQVLGVRRVRTGSLAAAVAWVLVGLLGPQAVGIAPGSTSVMCVVMMVLLLGCAGLSHWPHPAPSGRHRARPAGLATSRCQDAQGP